MFQVNVLKHRTDAVSLGLPDRAIQAEEQPCSELRNWFLLLSSPATAIGKGIAASAAPGDRGG